MGRRTTNERLSISPSGNQMYRFSQMVQRAYDEFNMTRPVVVIDFVEAGLVAVEKMMDEGKYGNPKGK